MSFSIKRFRSRVKTNAYYYLKCGANTVTFVFWASLYLLVMKLTIFKNNTPAAIPVKDWSAEPDNYTKWMVNKGQAISAREVELAGDPNLVNSVELWEPDNTSLIELGKRVERVYSVCQKRSLLSQRINNKEFFVDHAHNVVWCNIFKAASTSWLYRFNILSGYDKKFLHRTRQNPLTLARKKYPRPSEEELRDAVNTPGVVSFLIVREPFERLLSAYRDKLENITPPYYRKLARAIVAKHRETATKIFGPIKSFGPTFYEFVAYLIEKYKTDNQSFEFDEHWAPYYRFCTPCALNFSVIAKVESLSRDSAYIINQLGLGYMFNTGTSNRKMRFRTVMNKSRDGRNTHVLLKYYFKQIDKKMLNDLLGIYGTDFEMFGYDSKVYEKYVRK